MKKSDFYNLNVGQVIYYNGVRSEICSLFKSRYGDYCSIDFMASGQRGSIDWSSVCEDCSLEPKQNVSDQELKNRS